MRRPSTPPVQSGQATVEFVGTIPLLLLAATCCVQALLLALGVTFAQVAADRAARGAPRSEVVSSIPSGWRRHVHVEEHGERSIVRLRTPVLLPGAGRWLDVTASAEAPT